MKPKRCILLTLFSITLTNLNYAQNLVLNPSFESVNIANLNCSWYLNNTQFVAAINNWSYPTTGSTDVFNTAVDITCFSHPLSTNSQRRGQQSPRTGNGMSSIYTKGSSYICNPYREYLQGELSSPLVSGETYEIKYYVSLTDKSRYGTTNFGVKFTANKYNISNGCTIPVTPDACYTGTPVTDKNGWTQIQLSFTPLVSGLNYFTIGNFYSDLNTNYVDFGLGLGLRAVYFVDDVSVINLSELPISLNYFNVREGDNRVEIEWETASEENNEYFAVERTIDGSLWTMIDSLPGSGTTDSPMSYRAYDDNPIHGINYYRLKQMDSDGKITYSRVETMEFKSSLPKIFPNPAKDVVYIEQLELMRAEAFLLNSRGAVLTNIIIKESSTPLDISNYAPGVYFIQIISPKGVGIKKLIIQ